MNKRSDITCLQCGSYQTWATDTRHGNLTRHSPYADLIVLGLKEYTRRRRRCSDCGHAWNTVEVPAVQLQAAADEINRLRLLIKKAKWNAGVR